MKYTLFVCLCVSVRREERNFEEGNSIRGIWLFFSSFFSGYIQVALLPRGGGFVVFRGVDRRRARKSGFCVGGLILCVDLLIACMYVGNSLEKTAKDYFV